MTLWPICGMENEEREGGDPEPREAWETHISSQGQGNVGKTEDSGLE